jgi:hypothetical protein
MLRPRTWIVDYLYDRFSTQPSHHVADASATTHEEKTSMNQNLPNIYSNLVKIHEKLKKVNTIVEGSKIHRRR